jgi:hypothetical protein
LQPQHCDEARSRCECTSWNAHPHSLSRITLHHRPLPQQGSMRPRLQLLLRRCTQPCKSSQACQEPSKLQGTVSATPGQSRGAAKVVPDVMKSVVPVPRRADHKTSPTRRPPSIFQNLLQQAQYQSSDIPSGLRGLRDQDASSHRNVSDLSTYNARAAMKNDKQTVEAGEKQGRERPTWGCIGRQVARTACMQPAWRLCECGCAARLCRV